MSMGIAVKVGLGVGAATAVGTFLGHEQLENDGEWTDSNSMLGMATVTGALALPMVILGGARSLGVPNGAQIGTGVMFGGLAGNVAGMVGAMLVD